VVLVAAVVALMASPALGQQRQRGGRGAGGGQMGPSQLLTQKSVQEELKLSEDQIKEITAFNQKQAEARRGLRDLDQEERQKKTREMNQEAQKTMAKILKPEQSKRLQQISLQVQGSRAFSNATVAKELNLTDDQKKQLQEIQRETMEKTRDLFQGGGGDRQEMAKKMQELQKDATTKAMKVLSSEQKTKWKEMTGEPFKGQITFGQPRRRGGQ
jgi:hypothetical protein